MTDQNNAVQAAEQDQLSDGYVNSVIREHGYGHPAAVAARLWQWIGLHGGENGVTLLIYEAHKALSKLRAPAADSALPVEQALSELVNKIDPGLDSGDLLQDAQRASAALGVIMASAPVAGEAQPVAYCQPDDPVNSSAFSWPGLGRKKAHTVPLYAAPQASEAVCSCPSGDGSLRHPCAVHPQASGAVRTHNDAIEAAAKVCIDIARQYDPQNSQEHALASELYAAARIIRKQAKEDSAALSAQPGAQKEQSDA